MTRFQASLPLPVEIITIIGEFLAGDNQFGTLASLNVASRLLREATNIPLWTTVILDSKMPTWETEGNSHSAGHDKEHFTPPDPLSNFKYVR